MTTLNVTGVVDSVSTSLDGLADKIAEALKTADMTDPSSMLKLQMLEGQYESALKLGSAMVSDLKNAVSTIAQKS